MKTTVIGLGKLGLPLVATIASKGFFVYGVDVNKNILESLNRGITAIKEPGLQYLIKKNKSKIYATQNTKEAILNSDITFIVTPTPSKSNGYFSLKFVNKVVKDLARALRVKKEYHLVVIVSTVLPGSTDEIKKILEKQTGKICGKDFGLCYNPEFIALGSVLYNLLNPDFVLIGESDKKAGDTLEDFYKKYCDNNPKISRMNFVNAELTKISVNNFITTKISYANMLSEICEKLPGGNVDTVTSAIGLDSRIGSKYLKGGPAYGGPCFPRDNVAFISLAKKLKVGSNIPQATHNTNLRQAKRLIKLILNYYQKGRSVGILGLAYKPDTDVVEESLGLILANALKSKGIKINLHDPWALEKAKIVLGNERIKYFEDLKQCIQSSNILVISTNWTEYKTLKKDWLKNDPKIIIDPWRIISSDILLKNITYIPVGINTTLV